MCYQCSGVSLTEGMILALLATVSTTGLSRGTQYIVTSSDYAPVAGAGVTITAQLVDSHGNAVHTAGITVTWSKTGSDASFSSPTSVTNASGIATITFTTDFAGVSHVVTATDANSRTGSTASITSVVGPYTVAWAAGVVLNGGVNPTATEQAAADRYYRNCLAAGLTTLIISEILCISSSLIGATTPFLFSGAHGAVWGNLGPGNFVDADVNINGLKGNGTNKGLNTFIVPSTDPDLTDTSASLIAYIQTIDTTGHNYSFGVGGAGDSSHWAIFNGAATIGGYCWRFVNSGTDFITGSMGGAAGQKGYVLVTRTASNLLTLYGANSTSPWAALGTASGAQTGARSNIAFQLYAFCLNGLGLAQQFIDGRASYLGVAKGMTSAQGQAHYNAVQQFLIDKGGGSI